MYRYFLLQIHGYKTTTPFSTKAGHKTLLIWRGCLSFLLERTYSFVMPSGENLFRSGNYFLTDDGKATIKTTVGD